MRIHTNNSSTEKAEWLVAQLTPGQLMETDPDPWHVFTNPTTDKSIRVGGKIWVMFLSPDTGPLLENETWVTVVHDGAVYATSVFNFLQWFDSEKILPVCWKDMLDW